MAGISALQRLLDNALTANFARSLKHSDLPEGWADNPEIVQMAEDAYREMGTESPFFKAWNALGGDDVPVRVTHATQGDVTRSGEVVAPFDEFKKKFGGIYTLPKENPFSNEILDTFGGMYPYEYNLFTNAKVLDFTTPPKGKKTKTEQVINGLFSRQDKKDIGETTGGGFWNPVESFYDGDLWADTDRATQNRVLEKLRAEFDADAIRFNDNPNYGWDSQSIVVFDPVRLKSTSNRGTFNPADPNIYRALPLAAGVTGGLLAMDAGEAEAARPKHVDDLVEKLYLDNFDGMDFGKVSGKALKNWRKVEPETPEGPLKVSGKNVKKFLNKRVYQDHLEPEEFSDGVNALFHGSRTRVFPGREEGLLDLYLPKGEYAWRGVAAPKDDFSALVTAYKYPIEEMKKELNAPSGGRPNPPYPNTQKEGALPGRLTTVEGEQKLFEKSTIPDSSAIRKGIIPLATGGLLLTPEEAQAEQERYARLEKEQALGSPLADPVDLLLAPMGVTGLIPKLASVAAEVPMTYGMDKMINGLLDWWEGD